MRAGRDGDKAALLLAHTQGAFINKAHGPVWGPILVPTVIAQYVRGWLRPWPLPGALIPTKTAEFRRLLTGSSCQGWALGLLVVSTVPLHMWLLHKAV